MLRIEAIGNLGSDPEVRFTAKGAQVVSFRIAINQVKYDADGERQESTEWFRVRVMGRQGEYAGKLTKGTRIYVNGRLDISHWRDKESQEPRVGFDIWADEVQNAGGRREESPTNGSERSQPRETASRPGPARNAAPAEDTDLDDLPF